MPGLCVAQGGPRQVARGTCVTYSVKEIFYTLQGEGAQAGRAAVFCRFAGCNLWSGREADRAKGTGGCARWCDTDFVKGKPVTAEEFVDQVIEADGASPCKHVVLTGGEPMLQVDLPLLEALRSKSYQIDIETNGSVELPPSMYDLVHHLTVSPKLKNDGSWDSLVQRRGHECKVVVPGSLEPFGWTPARLLDLQLHTSFLRYSLQPMDVSIAPDLIGATVLTRRDKAGGDRIASYQQNVEACLAFLRNHPSWFLSLQTHKFAGVP
jgi:organic radical activating enzyme